MKHSVVVEISGCRLFIEETDGFITQIHFRNELPVSSDGDSKVLRRAICQLEEYFAGERKCFDLPIRLTGTAFQEKVWQELKKIPYGETVSYGQVASNIGNPKASRAVGGANHTNPVSIVIPCHRVIGANGKLTGYGGGLDMKKLLLDLEQKRLAQDF
ncbi:MAG: methylated-DNA--[protein]-cysteine S-methyltransferase [Planctomycetaceae bacterium]|nr:methylated-DNA--[protein]-cysteine S-methyltransferase [Planctomycetaceae bacterium]